ncbi:MULTISPECIES: hypothetical protein [unclassified Carboxylicivirga]|uniref:hypothetical protein n=1 Tax=Carboxylicivirga TaxID=1628153 RepID=UPI003D348B2B
MGNKFYIALFITFFVLSSAWSQQRKQNRQDNKAFLKAFQYLRSDDYERAITAFQDIVERSPDFTEAYLQLGLSYLNTNKGAAFAIPVFKQGIARLSAEEQEKALGQDFLLALGQAYQARLMPDSARQVYQILLTRIAANDDAYRTMVERELRNCEYAELFLANPIGITITNLGERVNSPYDDHSPLMSVFEDQILFTSRRKVSRLPLLDDGQAPEKVYRSTFKQNQWQDAQLLNVFFKNQVHESGLSLSPDGKTLFIYRSDVGGKSIYMSLLENNQWSEPVKLPYPINTSANETHASISADQSTLFFTSDRAGGKGGLDIYMSKKNAYGQWGPARNLGDVINTPYDEETSMMHVDGKTLYFASEGHNSMGRLDVFYAQMRPDSSWTFPVNLGYPINTPDDDFFFLPTLDKGHAYYASSRFDDNYGGSDIYRVEFAEGYSGEMAVVEGKVGRQGMDKSHLRILVTRMTDRQLVGDYRPDKRTGEYTLFLEAGHEYKIETCLPEKVISVAVVDVKPLMTYQLERKVYSFEEIEMTPPLRQPIVPKSLAEHNKEALVAIKEDIKQLEVLPFYTIQVLALRYKPLFASMYLKGLDANDLKEVPCKDGFTRYLYGAFRDLEAARTHRRHIMKMGKFNDSFVRRMADIDVLKVQ